MQMITIVDPTSERPQGTDARIGSPTCLVAGRLA
jgi:hypothetical protein